MGQTLSSNNNSSSSAAAHTSSRLMTSPSPLRQSLKRVYRLVTFIFLFRERYECTIVLLFSSVNLDDKKRNSSCSLPASPSVHKRLGETQAPESPTKMSITLESVLKNFEEFAQHQWPLWAKRRGWVTELPAETATSTSLAAPVADENNGSGRVVQVDKDKWVFHRHRGLGKKSEPSASPVVRRKHSKLLSILQNKLRFSLFNVG